MSGDAQISGRINVSPPITWGELHDKPWALEKGHIRYYPDAFVRLNTVRQNTPLGEVLNHAGVAIVPTEGETSARTLLEDVDRIVKTFGTAPDGTKRTFTGFLHVIWADGEEIYRVIVENGQAVEVYPEIIWPKGAGDEDAVPKHKAQG